MCEANQLVILSVFGCFLVVAVFLALFVQSHRRAHPRAVWARVNEASFALFRVAWWRPSLR